MSGKIIFRPIQANFKESKDPNHEHNTSYCRFKLGWHRAKSSIARLQENCSEWKEAIVLERNNNEHFVKVIIKDKDRFKLDALVGKAKINLEPVINKGKVLGWYNLYRKKQLTAELLLEIEYLSNE